MLSNVEDKQNNHRVDDPISIDRHVSLLDRRRLHRDANMLRGFVSMFWMTMLFFAAISFVKNSRQSGGTWLSFHLIHSTMSGYFGLLCLGVELLFAFLLHICMYVVVRPSCLAYIHVFSMLFALKRSSGWACLQTMSYLMVFIVLQLKLHSFAMLRKSQNDDNCCWSQYLFHMISPNVVYEASPKRTKVVDYRYIMEKLTGAVFCWLLAHILIEHYMLSHLNKVRLASMESVLLDILPSVFIPSILVYNILFLLLFEFWLSCLAECLGLSDRHYFADWWNSNSFADFSRTWNIPVHRFIKKHIYKVLLEQLGAPKSIANFGCFFVSACLHELVMWAALGRRRLIVEHKPIIFAFQMLQLPLMKVGRVVHRWSPIMANLFFWFGMLFAPPLITILYIRTQ